MCHRTVGYRKRLETRAIIIFGALALIAAQAVSQAVPSHVDITWMSIANMYFEFGSVKIVADGYINRIPQENFYGGGGGLARTYRAQRSDGKAVHRVLRALGGRRKVTLLLTGHSHFDHSFDIATWSHFTGARIIGPKTTCLQAEAEGLPRSRCAAVYGGEKISLSRNVIMRVIRWNHSGDASSNPEQHNPIELTAVPHPDPGNGGLRAGVTEDFPNGGGSRAFLFTVNGPHGRFSCLYEDSSGVADLDASVVVDGTDYGAPLHNLKSAMRDAGITSVDLWIGTGGAPIAELVLPVIHPKAYLPVHWDGLWRPFRAGVPEAYADPALEKLLVDKGVRLVRPRQYMDKWRLCGSGINSIANRAIKRRLGF